ncbi:MAG TPA: TetR family transcriptional regulator [Mycobacterium sp.]|nr:TetR family transcriptional regulator [Mycobacterium sp.]
MVEIGENATVGLRERKKQRTRATLIDVAVELCLEQGYENTTVDQIAARADVSPRTFSRYFAAKDAVFMALLEDLVEAVAVELRDIPAEVPELTAMRDAHLAALRHAGVVPRLSDERIGRMLKVINSTPELRLAAAELHPDSIVTVMAERMGVEPDDRRLRLVIAVWTAIIVTGCADLVGCRDGRELGAVLMAERISATFAHFAALTSTLPRRPS